MKTGLLVATVTFAVGSWATLRGLQAPSTASENAGARWTMRAAAVVDRYAALSRCDSNGDGALDESELTCAEAQLASGAVAAGPAWAQRFVASGPPAWVVRMHVARFFEFASALDGDRNGRLDADELRSARETRLTQPGGPPWLWLAR